jgi:hypothetical protein
MGRARLTLLAAVVCLVGQRVSAQVPTRESLLARTSEYVARFQADFSRIVGVEHYTQVQRDTSRRSRTRQLISEVFFFGQAEEGGAMTVRSVQQVDGRVVEGAAVQVQEALSLSADRRVEKLRALANASSRYNLGSLQRNFNEPTLALMLGSSAYRKRFRFKVDGVDEVDGMMLRLLTFTETGAPTVIRDGRSGRDIPASGRLWIDDSGIVWRTELHLDRSDTFATIRVEYRHDSPLDAMVPATMDEDYRYREKDTQRLMFISGHATYTDYRRFETSARIVQ